MEIKNKKFLYIILLFICLGNIFGQENEENIISIGTGVGFNWPFAVNVELFISYERIIIPQLSVSINLTGQLYPFAFAYLIFDSVGITDTGINSIFGYVIDSQIHWFPFNENNNFTYGNFNGITNISREHFHVDLGVGYGSFLTAFPSIVISTGLGWKNYHEKSFYDNAIFDDSDYYLFFRDLDHKTVHSIGLRGEVFIPLNRLINNKNNFIIIPFNIGFRYTIGIPF